MQVAPQERSQSPDDAGCLIERPLRAVGTSLGQRTHGRLSKPRYRQTSAPPKNHECQRISAATDSLGGSSLEPLASEDCGVFEVKGRLNPGFAQALMRPVGGTAGPLPRPRQQAFCRMARNADAIGD